MSSILPTFTLKKNLFLLMFFLIPHGFNFLVIGIALLYFSHIPDGISKALDILIPTINFLPYGLGIYPTVKSVDGQTVPSVLEALYHPLVFLLNSIAWLGIGMIAWRILEKRIGDKY